MPTAMHPPSASTGRHRRLPSCWSCWQYSVTPDAVDDLAPKTAQGWFGWSLCPPLFATGELLAGGCGVWVAGLVLGAVAAVEVVGVVGGGSLVVVGVGVGVVGVGGAGGVPTVVNTTWGTVDWELVVALALVVAVLGDVDSPVVEGVFVLAAGAVLVEVVPVLSLVVLLAPVLWVEAVALGVRAAGADGSVDTTSTP